MPGGRQFMKPEPVDNPGGSDELERIFDNFAIDIKFNNGKKFEAERNFESRNAAVRAVQAHYKPQSTADAGELAKLDLASYIERALWDVYFDGKQQAKQLGGSNKVLLKAKQDLVALFQSHFQHQADQLRRECEAEVVKARIDELQKLTEHQQNSQDWAWDNPGFSCEMVEATHIYDRITKLTNQPTPQEPTHD